ncbi:MAG TPA: transposase, partial [Roseiflexaceae bacterium]|nr:transposase [Roseiflexaceae bacterium]
MRRDPRTCQVQRTRWTLAALRTQASWLRLRSHAALYRLLKRLGICRKRARSYIRSPDPHYDAKLAELRALRAQVQAASERLVLLYLDEVTIERQPSVAPAYEARGRRQQPRARRSWSANTETRLVATLAAHDGRVVFRRGRVSIDALVAFYQQLRSAYPTAERIYVVMDNWPVHFHPDVLIALEAQETRWPLPRPKSWAATASKRAERKWGHLKLPIQLVPLPTYASWCNRIEKLWRKLRQDLTHLHEWANDLPRLRDEIDRFLTQFADGSDDLLRYVG